MWRTVNILLSTAHTNSHHMPRGVILITPSLQTHPYRGAVSITPSFSPSERVILCLLEGDFLERLTEGTGEREGEREKRREREMKNQRPAIKRQLCLYTPHQMNGWWFLSYSFMTFTAKLTRDKVKSFMCFSTH